MTLLSDRFPGNCATCGHSHYVHSGPDRTGSCNAYRCKRDGTCGSYVEGAGPGLIPAKVERVKKLTTKTKRDVCIHRERGQFSVEGAICAQVEQEDLIRWSERPEPRPLAGELPGPNKTTLAGLYVFIKGVMP